MHDRPMRYLRGKLLGADALAIDRPNRLGAPLLASAHRRPVFVALRRELRERNSAIALERFCGVASDFSARHHNAGRQMRVSDSADFLFLLTCWPRRRWKCIVSIFKSD